MNATEAIAKLTATVMAEEAIRPGDSIVPRDDELIAAMILGIGALGAISVNADLFVACKNFLYEFGCLGANIGGKDGEYINEHFAKMRAAIANAER